MKPKYTAGYKATIALSELLIEALEKRTSNSEVQICTSLNSTVDREIDKLEPNRSFNLFDAAMLAEALGCEIQFSLVKKE